MEGRYRGPPSHPTLAGLRSSRPGRSPAQLTPRRDLPLPTPRLQTDAYQILLIRDVVRTNLRPVGAFNGSSGDPGRPARPVTSHVHLAYARGKRRAKFGRRSATPSGRALTVMTVRRQAGCCAVSHDDRAFSHGTATKAHRARRATRDAKTESDRTVTNARTRRQRARTSLGVRDATAPTRDDSCDASD